LIFSKLTLTLTLFLNPFVFEMPDFEVTKKIYIVSNPGCID